MNKIFSLRVLLLLFVAWGSKNHAQTPNVCTYIPAQTQISQSSDERSNAFIPFSTPQTIALLSYGDIQYHKKRIKINYRKECGYCHPDGYTPKSRTYWTSVNNGTETELYDNEMELNPQALFPTVTAGSWQTPSGPLTALSHMKKGDGWGVDNTFTGESGNEMFTLRLNPSSTKPFISIIKVLYSGVYPTESTANTLVSVTSEDLPAGTSREFTPTITNEKRHRLELIPADLEVEASSVGVIGDYVKSNKPNSTIKHFVTPQKTTQLAQEYVIIEAAGLTASQISPGSQQIVTWDGGEAVPGDPLKRRVSRLSASRTVVSLKTTSGAVVSKMIVWVVWAPVIVKNYVSSVVVDTPSANGYAATLHGASWGFEALIYPSTIFLQSDDIPDLTGPSSVPTPEQSIGPHASDTGPFGQPSSKWDLSRCWRARSFAQGISASECGFNLGSIIASDYPTLAAGKIHQTTPNPASDMFPANYLEGNDYLPVNQNPYGLPNLSKVIDSDAPRHSVATTAGAVGKTLEIRYQFGAFSRVEIGSKWYNISDRLFWRFHSKFKKVSEAAANVDYNGDADKLDQVWINNGSLSNVSNGGF